MNKNSVVFGLLALFLVVGIGAFAMTQFEDVPTTDNQIPQHETRQGFWECVPHKPGVPPTEECATGIALDQSDGHIILDLSLYQAGAWTFSAGDHVRVSGVFVPANQLSTNHWQKYDIDGIMQVTSLEKI